MLLARYPSQMPRAHLLPLALPKRVSLVAQTVQSLRTALDAGYWRERMPGERELCRVEAVEHAGLLLRDARPGPRARGSGGGGGGD